MVIYYIAIIHNTYTPILYKNTNKCIKVIIVLKCFKLYTLKTNYTFSHTRYCDILEHNLSCSYFIGHSNI